MGGLSSIGSCDGSLLSHPPSLPGSGGGAPAKLLCNNENNIYTKKKNNIYDNTVCVHVQCSFKDINISIA